MEREIPRFQKGMCFVTWQRDKFSSFECDQALRELDRIGVDHIQFNVTQYQDRPDSLDIRPIYKTPSDKSLENAIRKARKLGMRVMLKPHVDLVDDVDGTYWRADIGFQREEDWKEWFRSYERFILHYARIAEDNGVEIFCVGTELSFASAKTSYWEKIIDKVRAVYSGKLIYAANWDNYKCIGFWDKLDLVGIDAYFPLTHKYDAAVEDIKKGWKRWTREIEDWHDKTGKPIIFTEIGYASARHAASEPWRNGGKKADTLMQARCYVAFFESVWDAPWLAGVYWWRWSPTIFEGGRSNSRFIPRNKYAEKILKEKYASSRKIYMPSPEALTEPSFDDMINHAIMGNGILDTGTLSPRLVTDNDLTFRTDWEEKNKEFRGSDKDAG